MSHPRSFACDSASRWLVDAFSALQPKLTWQEREIADARVLLIEPRGDNGARTVVMACSTEPWMEPITGITTAVSISALYVLEVATSVADRASSIDAIILMDRDSEGSRAGVLDIARRRAKLCNGGRMIVVAAGLTRHGGIFGNLENLKAVEGFFPEIPRFTDHPGLDPDVKAALQCTAIPILVVDPWTAEDGRWLPVPEFIDRFC
jgi:hypothetical protein